MGNTPVIFDADSKRWVRNLQYDPSQDDSQNGWNNDASDQKDRDAADTPTDPKDILAAQPLNNPPPLPLIDNQGKPIVSSIISNYGSDVASLPFAPHGTNIPILKTWTDPAGPGLAFDASRAAQWLINNHASNGDHYGLCQSFVRQALHAGGLNVTGISCAKEMVPLLKQDPRFSAVASGLGNQFYNSSSHDYKAQVGDICVWKGGPTGEYGHIQMCVGFRQDGSAVWMSDFEAREGNFSGMRNPVEHGGEFVMFRQHTVNPVVAAAPAIRTADPAASTTPEQHALVQPAAPAVKAPMPVAM